MNDNIHFLKFVMVGTGSEFINQLFQAVGVLNHMTNQLINKDLLFGLQLTILSAKKSAALFPFNKHI